MVSFQYQTFVLNVSNDLQKAYLIEKARGGKRFQEENRPSLAAQREMLCLKKSC